MIEYSDLHRFPVLSSGFKITVGCRFKSFLETQTSKKFRNLKRAAESIFVYSMQLLRISSSVKHASLCPYRQFTVFMFLHVHTTFNQDLFSAFSRVQIKVGA